MEKLNIYEMLARGIPESFIIMLAIYIFCKRRIDVRRYTISSILIAITGYTTRLLPINYGVNIILNIFLIILIVVNINKIELIKGIKVTLVALITQFWIEGMNIWIIKYIFRVDLDYVFSNPSIKVLYGIPSTIVFSTMVLTYYILYTRRRY